jgi:hypothetical protein
MTNKVNIMTDNGADVQQVSAAVATQLKQHRKDKNCHWTKFPSLRRQQGHAGGN